ncbi:pyridoxal phosphate-dependent decarboxylase family protein [Salisaeta longa]|uniref:pyridoxal phosphate-dependent decarboxylase family protein n=1 Tax=Salisaeta longa TaxID=503170 RepID=UPI0003FF2392|nr:pyridoxal-dependent decarboxylase [Salisaeta longa]
MATDALHHATFLGPKGENADELERLLLEVLRDHVFWRRNFHPSDPRLIGEREKRSAAYNEQMAHLRDRLFQILAELKRAAPIYSPRQAAHIVSDPSLPALIGYFAGMLYNQNNVVAEVSPETVREEQAYMAALARMVNYPTFVPQTLPDDARAERTPFSWGHLCSGGTTANLEALWIARNIRLYPLAVRLLAATDDRFAAMGRLSVATAAGDTAPLDALSTFALSNLPIDTITDLHLRITARLDAAAPTRRTAFEEALPNVRKAGLAGFLLRYNEAFPKDPARLPIVLISQAAHYCWEKNMDLIGLGADALHTVPVDQRIRLDTDALAERLHTCVRERQPVLGVVSICGTTEEGAIDPMHTVHAVRSALAAEGLTFWHHADAAFGGFFAAMLPKTDTGAFVAPDDLPADLAGPEGLLRTDNAAALAGLSTTDSLTIDPHKFGYVPYPSGAVLFRDYHVREAIAYAAPYLHDDPTAGFDGFLGQWTLEGSRPGAAAVSCYLSQELVPLTPAGHGRMLRACIATNQRVHDALTQRFADSSIRLVPFHPPETVAFCFLLIPASCRSMDALNAYSQRIWQRMTVDGREDINQYDLLISKTEVDAAAYDHVLADRLPAPLLHDARATAPSLQLLRTCLMNPFQADWNAADPPFATRVADYIYTIAHDVAP